jgi:hypothetical protein
LEVREVTPCFICGGWPEMVNRFAESGEFSEWRLPDEQILVLCASCELEDFMTPNGWGRRLGLHTPPLPIHSLQFVRAIPSPMLGKDRFCPQCNLRLAFLKIVANRNSLGEGSLRIPQ